MLVLVPHPLVTLHLLSKLRLKLPLLSLLGYHTVRPQSGKPILVPSLNGT